MQRGLQSQTSGNLYQISQKKSLHKKYSTRNLAMGAGGSRSLVQKLGQQRNASTAVLRGYRLDGQQPAKSKLLDPKSYKK